MRGKAALSAFPRVVLAAIGYFCKTYETLTMRWDGRQDAQNSLKGNKNLAPAQTNYLWA